MRTWQGDTINPEPPDSPRLPVTGEEEPIADDVLVDAVYQAGITFGKTGALSGGDFPPRLRRRLTSLRSQLSQAEGRIRELEGERLNLREHFTAAEDLARRMESRADTAEQALSQATREREEARRERDYLAGYVERLEAQQGVFIDRAEGLDDALLALRGKLAGRVGSAEYISIIDAARQSSSPEREGITDEAPNG